MGNLLLILLVLFGALAIVVKVTEKKGKPMSHEEQSKYGKITIVLIFILLILSFIKLM